VEELSSSAVSNPIFRSTGVSPVFFLYLCIFLHINQYTQAGRLCYGLMAIPLAVSKKNILLTIWLALPITIVSLLMVWIFYSLDKDRLMDDAVPYGAGAGDTGNANAIGEWLAGNNANAISLAVKARREGLAIDPRDWPGGVEVHISASSFHEGTHPTFGLVNGQGQWRYVTPGLPNESKKLTAVYTQEEIASSTVYCGNGFGKIERKKKPFGKFQVISVSDLDGHILKPISLEPQIPDPNLQTSEPMVIEVRMESVYEESP
jgi:hypothetical protein